MQAFIRGQGMHSSAMLLLGAFAASTCWLAAGPTLVCAQTRDASMASIRIVKGAGPIEYPAPSEGIQLRLIKGVLRTDYALRPRIRVPSPPPARLILRTSITSSSPRSAANPGFHSQGVLLPSIQETHDTPTRSSNWGTPQAASTVQVMHDEEIEEPTYRPKSVSRNTHAASISSLKIPQTTDAPTSHVPPAKSPEPTHPATTSARSKTAREPAESTIPASSAPSNASVSPSIQRDDGQDWPDRKTLYHIVVLQVIGTVSASLLVSLAIVISAFFLLRRLREQLPALVRVDAPMVGRSDNPSYGMPAQEVFVEETTAQPFDLGPTYEQERLLKEESERRQEQAVLRSIFEANLALREQLIELETAAA